MGYLETGDNNQAPTGAGTKVDPRGCSPIEIRELLGENLKLNKEIHVMVKSVKKYMMWQQIWSIFKILIIVVPIVLGLIYLPAMLQPLFEQYKDLMGGIGI